MELSGRKVCMRAVVYRETLNGRNNTKKKKRSFSLTISRCTRATLVEVRRVIIDGKGYIDWDDRIGSEFILGCCGASLPREDKKGGCS